MKKTIVSLLVCTLLCVSLVTGCKSELADETTSTIYINKEEEIVGAYIESFDKAYYDEKELKDIIKEKVKEVNEILGKKQVKLDTFKVKDKKAKLILNYKTLSAYNAFENIGMEIKKVSDYTDEFPKIVTLKGEEASLEDIKKEKDYKVISTEEGIDIMVEGTIVYISENVEKIKDNRVKTTANQKNIIIYK